jgi:hypothetical protein
MSNNHCIVINLPPLSDEAAVAIHDFLQDAIDRFESQYFVQIHRYYRSLEQYRTRRRDHFGKPPNSPKPIDRDPPF